MGQTEAPLTIRRSSTMTISELMTIMTAGMAHVRAASWPRTCSSPVDVIHLLTAVTRPRRARLMAKIIVPETDKPKTAATSRWYRNRMNAIDAWPRRDRRLHLSLNVAGMLDRVHRTVALVNGGSAGQTRTSGLNGRTAYWSFPAASHAAWLHLPADRPRWAFREGRIALATRSARAWCSTSSCLRKLGEMVVACRTPRRADKRSFIITTYALCGLANFSSIAIQIGGSVS